MDSSFRNWVVASSCWLLSSDQTPATIAGRLSNCNNKQSNTTVTTVFTTNYPIDSNHRISIDQTTKSKKQSPRWSPNYLFLDNGGRLKRSSELLLSLETLTALLLEALFALTLPDLDHVVLPPPATFVGVDCNLVAVAANLGPSIGPERHRFDLAPIESTTVKSIWGWKNPRNFDWELRDTGL